MSVSQEIPATHGREDVKETELPAVKVKALQWRKYGNQHGTGWQGIGAIGYLQYIVDRGPDGEEGWFWGDRGFDTEDQAKAAAQADYEQCILSALTLKDDPGNGGDGEAERTWSEPPLTCPHIDRAVASGTLPDDVISELDEIRDINSQLRYGTWYLRAELDAKETEALGYLRAVGTLQDRLAETRATALEEAANLIQATADEHSTKGRDLRGGYSDRRFYAVMGARLNESAAAIRALIPREG